MVLFLSLKKNTGFTLVEIVVSALIFALAVAGLFATISSLNRPGVESFEEVQAAYVGKEVAERLRSAIDAEVWAEGDGGDPLIYSLVEGQSYTFKQVRSGIEYQVDYSVESDPSGGRWVNMTISW